VRRGRIAGIVLAAGSSSRLGSNKLLIRLDAETVVRRMTRRTVDAGLSPVIVVTGFEADRIGAELAELPVEVVTNRDHVTGMHTSVRVGIERVPADCDGLIIVLADMPLVTSAMLMQLVARFRAGSEPLVISRYGEVQAPPTLYSRVLFPALAAAGEGGGRRVIRDHQEQVAELRWASELLVDLDTAEDVVRLGGTAR
jgi:molybdenum cofactor cytidylyltransferase